MRLTTLAAFAATFALVAAPAAIAQDREGWPSSLTIGTASQGGTYFIYGTGLGALITEELGINASGEVTGGPVQNATLVQTGDHEIGLVTMGPAYEAWTGVSELAPGLEHKSLRALFPMYQTPFQVVALRSSNIASIADLGGKRVSVGPAGGTAATYTVESASAITATTPAGPFGPADVVVTSAFGTSATAANGFTYEAPFTLTLDPPAGALTGGEVDTAYGPVTFTADGGSGTYSFAVTAGALPDGLALDADGTLSALQEGFRQMHGLQCGFCTPGMIMRAHRLLQEKPNPTEEEIRFGIAGNLCRCTGYQNIVKAIQYAAAKLNGTEYREAAE